MPTKEQIIAGDIVGCPKHDGMPPPQHGICAQCDEITAVWADYFEKFSSECSASGAEDPDIEWGQGHDPNGRESTKKIPSGTYRNRDGATIQVRRKEDLMAEEIAQALHVFHNDWDWVVARSATEAASLASHFHGCAVNDIEQFDDAPLPDDQVMGIWLDGESGKCKCAERAEGERQRTEGAWAAHGRLAQLVAPMQQPCVQSMSASDSAPQPAASPVHLGPFGHYADCPIGYERKTCGEWAVENGPGLLASTEF